MSLVLALVWALQIHIQRHFNYCQLRLRTECYQSLSQTPKLLKALGVISINFGFLKTRSNYRSKKRWSSWQIEIATLHLVLVSQLRILSKTMYLKKNKLIFLPRLSEILSLEEALVMELE